MSSQSNPATVVAMQPFVPARDFGMSRLFYEALGFAVTPISESLADVRLERFSFILQDFYVEQWASNFMMHMRVTDIESWWRRIVDAALVDRFVVRPPQPPRVEPWGARVAHVFDPAGVLWHIAEHLPVEAQGR